QLKATRKSRQKEGQVGDSLGTGKGHIPLLLADWRVPLNSLRRPRRYVSKECLSWSSSAGLGEQHARRLSCGALLRSAPPRPLLTKAQALQQRRGAKVANSLCPAR